MSSEPQSTPGQDINVKVVLVGDDGVGKTSICLYYKEGRKHSGDLPVIATNFAKKEFYDEKKAVLVLWDSACNDEYSEIRPRAYPKTDFFLLCFALNSLQSLENAASVWMKEIDEFTKNAKVFLIGTKNDSKTLTDNQISPFRKVIDPYLYLECSSATGENIQRIFDDIARIAIDPESIQKQIFREEEKPESKQQSPTQSPDKQKKTAKSSACLLI